MATYHLYFLRGNQLVGTDSITALDGPEAIRIAGERARGCTVEVWDAQDRITVLSPLSRQDRSAA